MVAGEGPIVVGDLARLTSLCSAVRVYSAQRMADSGLNIQGKDRLGRPFDLHAARGLDCGDCHDVHAHGEHGRSVATKGCVDCHEALAGHDWLPEKLTHLERVACESCHVGQVYLAASSSDPPGVEIIVGQTPSFSTRVGLDGKERLAPFRPLDILARRGEPLVEAGFLSITA